MKIDRLIGRFYGRFKRSSFPVLIKVVAERQGSKKVFEDRAKRVSEGGADKYLLLNIGKEFVAPTYQHLMIDRKGREHMIVYSPNPHTYTPVDLTTEGKFNPTSETDKAEIFMELVQASKITQNRDRLTNLLMTLAPFLVLGVVLVVSIFVLQEVDKAVKLGSALSNSLGGISNNFVNATNTLVQACTGLQPVGGGIAP